MKKAIAKVWATLLGGALVLACTGAAQAGLITNGSFESGSFVADGNNAMTVNPGSSAITGWTVANGSMAWINTPNNFGLSATNGTFFLDLTGYDDAVPYGGVSQNVATVLGGSYTLSFDLGGSTNYGASDSLTVCAGATCSVQAITPVTTNDWSTRTLDFTGTGGTLNISFTGTTASKYIGLDNVSLTGPVATTVPEPFTLSLFGAGLFAAGALRRRNKKSKEA